MTDRLTIANAQQLLKDGINPFTEVFSHGTLVIEFYQPVGHDLQQPHVRDEIYVIANGHGNIDINGVSRSVETGEVVFVPAGVPHRFHGFSDDFATWAMFYGPEGGEAKQSL